MSCPVKTAGISWEFRLLWQEELRRWGPPCTDPGIDSKRAKAEDDDGGNDGDNDRDDHHSSLSAERAF